MFANRNFKDRELLFDFESSQEKYIFRLQTNFKINTKAKKIISP